MRVINRRFLAASGLAAALALFAAAPALAALPAPDSNAYTVQTAVGTPVGLSMADPLVGALTFDVTSGPSHGNVSPTTGSMSCDGTTCTASVTYTSNGGYQGGDSFDYTVSDSVPETSPPGTISLTVDTPPAVSSFTTAVTSPTNSTSIPYSLVFTKSITGLTGGDFTNAGTATGCSFATNAASGTSFTITVTSCGPTGTLTPELATNAVADAALFTGPSSPADGTTLTLDRVAPTVTSFTTAVTSPTNSTSIGYTLTFSKSVSGLTSGDFSNAGTATGCTLSPSAASGTSFTITVTTCSVTGTLTPQLAANAVTDTAGNQGPGSVADGTTLTLDRVAPTLTGFTLQPGSDTGVSNSDKLTNAASLVYTITFSKSVTGLIGADFSATGSGAGTCTFTTGGSGSSWTVSANSCSEGTVTVSIAANAVTDAAGNTGPATQTATSTGAVTIDRTAPSLTLAPVTPSPTGSTSLDFHLTGNEALDCTTLSTTAGVDFGLTNITSIGPITGGGSTTCDIPALSSIGPGTSGNSTLSRAGTFSVSDLAGNAQTAVSGAPASITVNRIGPSVSTFVLEAGSDTGRLANDRLTNAATLVFDLTFNEPVSGLVAGDLSNTGTAAGCLFAPAGTAPTASWTVTLTGCSEGTVVLTLAANSVTDALLNTGPTLPNASATVTIDRTPPTLALAVLPVGPTNTTALSFTVSAGENLNCNTISPVNGTDFARLNVASIGSIIGVGTHTCTLPVTSSIGAGTTGVTSLTASGTFSVADDAGNVQTVITPTSVGVSVDLQAPTVATFALQAASDSGTSNSDRITNAATLVYDLVFSEPVNGLVAGDLSTTGTATGCVIAPAGVAPTATWTVTLTGCSAGTVTLNLAAGSVTDLATNAGPASLTPAATVTIDRTAPTLTLSAVTASPTSSKSLTFRITGNEALDCSTLSTVAGVDLAFTNVSAVGAVTGTGTTTCTIPVTSSIVPGLTGVTTLAKAGTFAMSDLAGNAQATLAGSPKSITVTPTDQPPVAHNDVGLVVLQNAVAAPLAVLANDTDPDAGTVLKIKSVTAASHGTLTITGGGLGLAYTPTPTYVGSDSFTYTITDGTLTSTAAVILNVVPSGTVTRLAGTDRYGTSAAISRASFSPGVPVVYIADGLGFPDALSGAPVAGIQGGPILLVSPTSIPPAVATELSRLKPARIVILGGTSVVSAAVQTSLKAFTTGSVTRISGPDRYATSAAISRLNFLAGVPVVYIADGLGFPDALSGAPVAGITRGPVLLVSPTSIPPVIATELLRLKPRQIVILGGASVVSSAVQTSLKAYTAGSVIRLSGTDRYGTSAAISSHQFASRVPVVYIADGLGFPDALSGAPVAAIQGGPILLVNPNSIPPVVASELVRLKPARIVILGGTGVVSAAVATSLRAYTT